MKPTRHTPHAHQPAPLDHPAASAAVRPLARFHGGRRGAGLPPESPVIHSPLWEESAAANARARARRQWVLFRVLLVIASAVWAVAILKLIFA